MLEFLHTLYTIKSDYMDFLEQIKNSVSVKSVLKEAPLNIDSPKNSEFFMHLYIYVLYVKFIIMNISGT